MSLPKLLRIRDVATLTGLSPRTIRRAVYAGRLGAVRLTPGATSPLFFTEGDVLSYLEAGRGNVRVLRAPRVAP